MKKKASKSNNADDIRPGSAKQVPAFFVPERNYKLLIMYILKTYGDNGLANLTYKEKAALLTNQVHWDVDEDCLKTAYSRWVKQTKKCP